MPKSVLITPNHGCVILIQGARSTSNLGFVDGILVVTGLYSLSIFFVHHLLEAASLLLSDGTVRPVLRNFRREGRIWYYRVFLKSVN